MNDSFHLLVVGMSPRLVRNLWDRVASAAGWRISHIVHPSFDRTSWQAAGAGSADVHFIRERLDMRMPVAEPETLASLERDGVPTIHNMIMSDRFVSKLSHSEAMAYATLLTRRITELYKQLRPTMIIGDFDGLHASIAFAVAKQLGIPWFAMYFGSIPGGCCAMCTALTPASTFTAVPRSEEELRAYAQSLLAEFEGRTIRVAAYEPPAVLSPSFFLRRLPQQAAALLRVVQRSRHADSLKFTDHPSSYSPRALVSEAWRLRRNLWKLRKQPLVTRPPAAPYAFFGLHMQPESSIDVFAHFFANQVRVIELMARSLPPTHRLLVKLHKSDAPNYSERDIARFTGFPGVEIVSPYADTFQFLQRADLVFSIQGTIGLEGAMLGKPVIMFSDSPMRVFPNVSTFSRTVDLPKLVREKLAELPPSRPTVLAALEKYLAPFHPASSNEWEIVPTAEQIDNYVRLFGGLASQLRQLGKTG